MRRWSWVLKLLAWLVIVCGLMFLLSAFVPDLPDEPESTMGDRVLAAVLGVLLVAGGLMGLAVQVRNRLVAGRNVCRVKSADLDALLQRRRELARSLMGLSEQFAARHGGDFAEVAAFMGTSMYSGLVDRGRESNKRLVPTFLVAAEAYPELAAEGAFAVMFQELRETEDRISVARADYGNATLAHNTRIQSFPSSVAARLFRLSEQEAI